MHTAIFIFSLLFLILFIWYLATTEDVMRRKVALGTITCLLAICILALFKWGEPIPKDKPQNWLNIKYGLDIQGGTQFLIQLGKVEGREPTAAMVDQAVEVIRKRIDSIGLAEPIIQPSGTDRIFVQIPGVSEADKTKYRYQLEKVAKLEFRYVHPLSELLIQQLDQGQNNIPFDYEILPYTDTEPSGTTTTRQLVVRKRADMGGDVVSAAFPSFDNVGRPITLIEFNEQGTKRFGELTEEYSRVNPETGQRERMAIVLDREVFSAPQILEPILTGSCRISGGGMTREEAIELASVLENPLQVPVTILDERGVDPSLGAESVKSGFNSGLIGLGLVILFMLAYYHTAGIISILALTLNIIILLGLLSQFGFTLTMPGVAGILLTIGMAVDGNVLIYERIREELDWGKKLGDAITAGFSRAFSSILDANVTTILSALILFWLGSGPIKGFAVTIIVGVLSSMFAALIITRAGFDWMFALGKLKKITMSRAIPTNLNFNFLGLRTQSYALSLLLVLGTFALFSLKKDSLLGVDFTGGNLATYHFNTRVPDDQLKNASGNIETLIQYMRTPGSGDEILSIRSPIDQAELVENRLTTAFPDIGLKRLSLEKVEGLMGRELATQATLALIIGMAAIFLYVAWRYEMGFAIGAIVALIHDVIIAMGLFALMDRQFSMPVVGAILTVAGYSINDTIVVFDRVREGIRTGYTGNLQEVMNRCLNLTLSRTLITSGTTLLAVIALYLFGGNVINDFALILLFGIIVGTYSSLFIAAPIALQLSKGKKFKNLLTPEPLATTP